MGQTRWLREDEPHDAMRRFKGALDPRALAILGAQEKIVARRLPQHRRIGAKRRVDVGDGRKLPVARHDALGALLRRSLSFRHDERHRLADMAHAAGRERQLAAADRAAGWRA